ncbi:Rieske (2Fe-2S) protein [Kibdelosporangium lantanae]
MKRFIEDMLARRFTGTDEDEADLRTAIQLNAARPGADEPRAEFVDALHKRLAAQQEGKPARSRRRFVQTTSVAAAAALGVTVDRVISSDKDEPADQLVPDNGQWQAVAASAELPEGSVRAFDLDGVAGFVRRSDGVVRAVSGICTHLGCKLALDAAERRLNCPCHRTTFSVEGAVVVHQLPKAPAALPRLDVRENNGAVEVYVPKSG